MERQPTVISLFAGCGGSSLGYKWAGFKELLAIDFDENSIETFRKNFKDVPAWKADITKITGKEIMDFCKIKEGELDVLDGSPPCQGFSTSNMSRKIMDNRNNLFMDFIRILDELRPKVFIAENVRGMIIGKMKGVFLDILQAFKEKEYLTKAKLMNAAYYGIPQIRHRIIFIGVRNDFNKMPTFPIRTEKPISFGVAISGIESINQEQKPLSKATRKMYDGTRPGRPLSDGNANGDFFTWTRLSFNKVCPTLTKASLLLHPTEPRYLNELELKRISTFPDDFDFNISERKTHANAWERMGNSVPPKFMEAIARHVKTEILGKIADD